MIPSLVENSKKSMRKGWHVLDDLTRYYQMRHLFILETVTTITVKCLLPIFIAAVVRETHSFIKIMQPISPNYNWENWVKQIKITEENLSQSFILCQLLRTKTLASGSKCIKHFLLFLPLFALYLLSGCDLFMTCLLFLKSPWWLVGIFCAPKPLI